MSFAATQIRSVECQFSLSISLSIGRFVEHRDSIRLLKGFRDARNISDRFRRSRDEPHRNSRMGRVQRVVCAFDDASDLVATRPFRINRPIRRSYRAAGH